MLRGNCNSQLTSAERGRESRDALKFLNSLQELRQLRTQIHRAADCCQTSFLNAPLLHHKQAVVESTREYICKVVVTVVDHLGCVSDNLHSRINWIHRLSHAQLRINCLKLKFLVQEQYNHTLVPSKLGTGGVCIPRRFPRYHAPTNALSTSIQGDAPLFITMQQSLASAIPVHDGLSTPNESERDVFHFQRSRKHERRMLQWRSSSDIESLLPPSNSKKGPFKMLKFK